MTAFLICGLLLLLWWGVIGVGQFLFYDGFFRPKNDELVLKRGRVIYILLYGVMVRAGTCLFVVLVPGKVIKGIQFTFDDFVFMGMFFLGGIFLGYLSWKAFKEKFNEKE